VDVVILAAGAGSRFGGQKQFTPVTPDNATLLEITTGNARRAGCDRAVIVTAPGHESDVLNLFADRPVAGLDVVTVVQHSDDLPLQSSITRDRPWGTAHALWAARDTVTGPFLLFNADDDYGPNAPATLIAALTCDDNLPHFVMLGFPLGSTLSTSGIVSRAVCDVDDSGRLSALREYSAIDGSGRVASGKYTGRALSLQVPVSMNAWAFTPEVFPLIEVSLKNFLASPELVRGECYLPAVINDAVREGSITVRVVMAPDPWCGMTWPGDRDHVARQLADRKALNYATEEFGLDALHTTPTPFGDGLINSTWRLDAAQGPHLLQRLNSEVFPDPIAVAENADAAAVRIDHALRLRGDNDPRHRIAFVRDPNGRPWVRDHCGGVWRAVTMVPDARSADPTRSMEVLAAARALGRFPGLVTEGSGPKLREILPGFHDTPARLETLYNRADTDAVNRMKSCRTEFDRLVELKSLADHLCNTNHPTRLVHNDAKLDNVLMDANTGEALCVVDLDTVMPGLAVHDFGDLVRSAVTGHPEDESDLNSIVLRKSVFHDLAKGYLEGAAGWIEDQERAMLIDGAIVITFEQTVRFLADYLAGDSYYPVDNAEHNLRRTRAQLRLLEELLASENKLRRYIDNI
jgi:thiamine kinase-like enzyme